MEVDEDDDFYAPEEAVQSTEQPQQNEQAAQTAVKPEQEDEDLEEGEEEDEGSDGSDSVCYVLSSAQTVANKCVGYRHHHREKEWNQRCSSFVWYLSSPHLS
jgi:hypothetical protein